MYKICNQESDKNTFTIKNYLQEQLQYKEKTAQEIMTHNSPDETPFHISEEGNASSNTTR